MQITDKVFDISLLHGYMECVSYAISISIKRMIKIV